MFSEEEQEFHKLYWLGKKPMSYEEIQLIMKIDLGQVRILHSKTREKREKTKSLRSRWLSKFQKGEMSFGDFLKVVEKKENKYCYYCGISEEQLSQAIKQEIIWTKRAGRGPSLEMDRIHPNEPYSNTENIVFACYWCNNAKTDTFNEEEFKEIGQVMTKIWNKRFDAAGINKITKVYT